MRTTNLLFAAAATLGSLATAPLAQAGPSCSQYAFTGYFAAQGANFGEMSVNAAPGTRLVGDAFTISDDGGPVDGFVSSGGIQGRDVNFVISWIEPSDTTWTFKGTVGDDGLVYRGLMHGPGFMSLWNSTTPLACNDPVIATKPLPDSVVTAPVPATTRVPMPVTP